MQCSFSKFIIFITLMVNSRVTYTDPNLPVTNIQTSILLKITMQMFSQIFFQDDCLTKVSICLAQKENIKSRCPHKYPWGVFI